MFRIQVFRKAQSCQSPHDRVTMKIFTAHWRVWDMFWHVFCGFLLWIASLIYVPHATLLCYVLMSTVLSLNLQWLVKKFNPQRNIFPELMWKMYMKITDGFSVFLLWSIVDHRWTYMTQAKNVLEWSVKKWYSIVQKKCIHGKLQWHDLSDCLVCEPFCVLCWYVYPELIKC